MTMVISQLTVVLVLGVCVRMQGLDQATISWAVILVAWGAVTFASLLIPTPGGLGVAEVVLVGVLGHGLPESDQSAVLAAVLLYRIATFLVPIPIGLVTYLYWRRSTAWRQPGELPRPERRRRGSRAPPRAHPRRPRSRLTPAPRRPAPVDRPMTANTTNAIASTLAATPAAASRPPPRRQHVDGHPVVVVGGCRVVPLPRRRPPGPVRAGPRSAAAAAAPARMPGASAT